MESNVNKFIINLIVHLSNFLIYIHLYFTAFAQAINSSCKFGEDIYIDATPTEVTFIFQNFQNIKHKNDDKNYKSN